MDKSGRSANTDRNHLISSVASVFQVLELFSSNTGPMTFSQLTRLAGKPKSSVHRILSTLMRLNLVKRDEYTGLFSLTLKMWSLGMSAFAGVDMVKIAEPHIRKLMEKADETAHLAVLDGPDWVTYLSKFESPRSIKVQFWVGKRVRSWRSATGRSMLAFLPATIELLKKARAYEIAIDSGEDRAELDSTLQRVRRRGYALTKGDNHPEMGGIAAPVRDHTGTVVGSCGIAIPIFRMNRKLIERCTPFVLSGAAAISAELGHQVSLVAYGGAAAAGCEMSTKFTN